MINERSFDLYFILLRDVRLHQSSFVLPFLVRPGLLVRRSIKHAGYLVCGFSGPWWSPSLVGRPQDDGRSFSNAHWSRRNDYDVKLTMPVP